MFLGTEWKACNVHHIYFAHRWSVSVQAHDPIDQFWVHRSPGTRTAEKDDPKEGDDTDQLRDWSIKEVHLMPHQVAKISSSQQDDPKKTDYNRGQPGQKHQNKTHLNAGARTSSHFSCKQICQRHRYTDAEIRVPMRFHLVTHIFMLEPAHALILPASNFTVWRWNSTWINVLQHLKHNSPRLHSSLAQAAFKWMLDYKMLQCLTSWIPRV